MDLKKILMGATLLLGLSLESSQTFAASKTFLYNGQNSEEVILKEERKETRYRNEVVDSTCTRQVPYTTNECRDVTRYREECRMVPGYEDCRMVPDTRCDHVTRYREECRYESGGRTCRPGPSRRVCVVRHGVQVCAMQPGADICTDNPRRRVCHNVPYTDRVCHRYDRRECRWIPERRQCDKIPYTVNECKDVVKYRNEQYACTRNVQIPYQVVVEKYEAQVLVNFETNPMVTEAVMTVDLSNNGELRQKLSEVKPQGIVGFVSSKLNERNDVGADGVLLKRELDVRFVDLRDLKRAVENGATNITNSESKINFKLDLPVVLGLDIDFGKQTQLTVYVTRKTVLGNTRVVLNRNFFLHEISYSRDGDYIVGTIDLKKLNADMGSKGEYKITIETQLDLSKQVPKFIFQGQGKN